MLVVAPDVVIPVTVPLVAALNVIAPAVPSPMLLLLMLTVVTTAPVFEMPVKADVVPEPVWPLTMLELTLNTPGKELLTSPMKDPAVVQLTTLLLFMLIVAVEFAVVIPWLRIISKVDEVVLVTVTVLLLTLSVNVPVGDVPV